MTTETRNAIIKSARINDENGFLTAWLELDYGGSGQGFGGFALYLPKGYRHATNQKNYAGHFIWRCMEIAGVSDWSKIAGMTMRAQCEHTAVHAIGHIVKEDWFNPTEDFKAWREDVA